MNLTDRERRTIADLERQFDPPRATVDPDAPATAGPDRPHRTNPAAGRPAGGGRAHRVAGPAGLLGALLLAAALLLAVPSSALLGATLVCWWLIARQGSTATPPRPATGSTGYRNCWN